LRIFHSFVLCLALAIPALTQSQPIVTKIATFPHSHRTTPLAPSKLIQGPGGNFYGVTLRGGPNDAGTIFLMTPQGGLKTLFSFDGLNGQYPHGPLLEGQGGNLFGTTSHGGAFGRGTIFKTSRAGGLKTLYSFCQQTGCPDGADPNPGLIRGLDGWFYGTAYDGGVANKGVVFRIGPNGPYQPLFSFGGHPNLGSHPMNLVQASDGNLYGVCFTGGANLRGTIFMVTPQGHVKLVHTFQYVGTEGSSPAGSLIQGADGYLYGNTSSGGANGYGTLFKISLQGAYQDIYDIPPGGLIQASDGNLWGTISGPDAISLTTSGSLVQDIHLYAPGVRNPGGLMQASDGKLYVPEQTGFIYAIDAGLLPPAPSVVGFRPASGLVGTNVVVSGANYVGATGVTFNGVSAGFVVNASGVITATVPVGASSGSVQVTTPGGAVASQTDFTVLP